MSGIGIEAGCCSVRCPQRSAFRTRAEWRARIRYAGDSARYREVTKRRTDETSARAKKAAGIFLLAVKFDRPITTESWAAIYCPLITASTQVGKSRAAAAPGLRPIHFSRLIAAGGN